MAIDFDTTKNELDREKKRIRFLILNEDVDTVVDVLARRSLILRWIAGYADPDFPADDLQGEIKRHYRIITVLRSAARQGIEYDGH